ncbi:DUF6776 family protein [Atopomonas sediminilitoris]|uniref:DUF6776 family protein n=1 Tax=Atopomonas sediminilitoris TaxID=2919919 RepID=UPI001F4D4C03|nr:DUF6776 family protein [Atopomonas sediminilitoris]MCJ8168540.1 hypothetical protein [Atopomonas sediminilitoris]
MASRGKSNKPDWQVRVVQPGQGSWKNACLTLLVVLLPLIGWAGYQWRDHEVGAALDGHDALVEQLAVLEDDNSSLQQRQAVLESGGRLAQQASEQSRQTIKMLEQQVFQLQQDLAFYKEAVAPGSRREGLTIYAFELQPTEDAQLFRYKFMLSRMGEGEKALKGRLKIEVLGKSKKKARSLPLAELSEGVSDDGIRFSFKHYQLYPAAGRFAELRLPEDFSPQRIRIMAEVEGQKQPVERTFDWINQE